MCNVFKPERCHHCSACNRCVLNMDHHCPWINNCVGFWNRKYFLLLLFYVNLTIFYVLVFTLFDFIEAIKFDMDAYNNGKKNYQDADVTRHIIIQVVFIIIMMLGFLLSKFTKFHVDLAFQNKTTIENLDKKQKNFRSVVSLSSFKSTISVVKRTSTRSSGATSGCGPSHSSASLGSQSGMEFTGRATFRKTAIIIQLLRILLKEDQPIGLELRAQRLIEAALSRLDKTRLSKCNNKSQQVRNNCYSRTNT